MPLYSWYPAFIKKWCEHKAVTTHPEWANHARYPAVNWFTYYELRDWLAMRGLTRWTASTCLRDASCRR